MEQEQPEELGGTGGTGGPGGSGAPGRLGERELRVLALERRGFPGPGAKERAIREELGLAPVRYYQVLNALLDDPRALAADPVTVNRLRRVREARRAAR
ncbi:DUF3263 domain-containing protein [Streptomyces sp. NPDC052020]|uniref:DUF3263 domain-containing protein n=1 Tax=Streptomyces sp. NPDC052020 TaxID=3155677 RepID=UPI0034284052